MYANTQGPFRNLERNAAPRTVDVDQGRYTVDKKEGHVSWAGWEFYLSFSTVIAL